MSECPKHRSMVCGWLLVVGSVTAACTSGELITLGRASEGTDRLVTTTTPAQPDPPATVEASDAAEAGAVAIAELDAAASPVSDPPDAGAAVAEASVPVSDEVTDAAPPPSVAVEAAAPEPFEFDSPVLVEALRSDIKDDNPTLTADLLQIFFSSSRGDDTDLWWAKRDSVDAEFEAPTRIDELSGLGFDASPAIEGDGLTLWFSRESEEDVTGLDIWVARREAASDTWSEPELVAELSSDADDIARPTGAGGRLMPMGSRRDGELYLTYLAARPSADAAFDSPQLIEELTVEGQTTADAFLTADGLTILFSHAGDGGGDLFVASRQALDQPFGPERPIDSLNSDGDDRDPWLSPDGAVLFFASDRQGSLAIYEAARRR